MSNPESVCRDFRYVHPELARLAQGAISALQRDVPGIAAFETWRSPERQTFLFAKGRTTAGPRVTRAKAWDSWHQFGLALDLACFFPGDVTAHVKPHWSWEFDRDKVREMFVTTYKMEPGPAFESGHFQLTRGLTIKDANTIARESGILAVWQMIDQLLFS